MRTSAVLARGDPRVDHGMAAWHKVFVMTPAGHAATYFTVPYTGLRGFRVLDALCRRRHGAVHRADWRLAAGCRLARARGDGGARPGAHPGDLRPPAGGIAFPTRTARCARPSRSSGSPAGRRTKVSRSRSAPVPHRRALPMRSACARSAPARSPTGREDERHGFGATHASRANVFKTEARWRLGADALVREGGEPANAPWYAHAARIFLRVIWPWTGIKIEPGGAARFPYAGISCGSRMIRHASIPAAIAVTSVWPGGEPRHALVHALCRRAHFEDRAATYTSFVRALVAQLRPLTRTAHSVPARGRSPIGQGSSSCSRWRSSRLGRSPWSAAPR